MHKYPIGIQDFRKIREDGLLYIDKTELIHTLIESGSYYFLSRPRRFGKSLLLSTIKEIFSGSKELFEGLWIENNRDWEQIHPVIHLKINKINYQKLGLYDALNKELDRISGELRLTLEETDLKDKFNELIEKTASQHGKAVLLIDEYDKPIIDYLTEEDLSIAEENRSVFKSFYSVIKDADPYLRFVLITGVSKFARMSIFSDLNNLNDITLHPRYATLPGITQQELEQDFQTELQEFSKNDPIILSKIKQWYNGYSWDGKNKVYNPFSLLRFMDSGVFQNFWFASGTPTFLIEQIRKRDNFSFEEVQAGIQSLDDFNIRKINPVTLLFQTGYLTIQSYDERKRIYTLGYPNQEVKESTLAYLLGVYRNADAGESVPLAGQLEDALLENDLDEVVSVSRFAAGLR